MEPYLSNGELVSQDAWSSYVAKLKEQTTEVTSSEFEEAFAELQEAIEQAVLKRAKNAKQPIGLLFSGGVDSTLIGFILKKHNIEFTAYTAGFEDEGTKEPEDITESKKAAAELGFIQKTVLINKEEAQTLFERTAKFLGKELTNVVSLGVGSVVVAAADLANKDGCSVLFGGLGSEEIFAGYQRHDEANVDEQSLQDECWSGLIAMWARDLARDCALGAGLNISVPTPFMDENVILTAMRIPASEKIKDYQGESFKKHCLRVIAQKIGLPEEFAWRPKRAAQYGSRLDSAMDKLARAKGMNKKEYCESLF